MIDNFLDALYSWFVSLLETVLNAFADVFLAIPVPDFVNEASSSITGFAGFLASILQLPYLVTVVMSAYALRFIIRRIPFVG